jgi:hypothetical protein
LNGFFLNDLNCGLCGAAADFVNALPTGAVMPFNIDNLSTGSCTDTILSAITGTTGCDGIAPLSLKIIAFPFGGRPCFLPVVFAFGAASPEFCELKAISHIALSKSDLFIEVGLLTPTVLPIIRSSYNGSSCKVSLLYWE